MNGIHEAGVRFPVGPPELREGGDSYPKDRKSTDTDKECGGRDRRAGSRSRKVSARRNSPRLHRGGLLRLFLFSLRIGCRCSSATGDKPFGNRFCGGRSRGRRRRFRGSLGRSRCRGRGGPAARLLERLPFLLFRWHCVRFGRNRRSGRLRRHRSWLPALIVKLGEAIRSERSQFHFERICGPEAHLENRSHRSPRGGNNEDAGGRGEVVTAP